MSDIKDQWLWVVDEELIAALARPDAAEPEAAPGRPVKSEALVQALALNAEGKTEEALAAIEGALEQGENSPDLQWTKAHLQFELGRYSEALAGYQEVLASTPGHKSAGFNVAVCLEKLGRFQEASGAFHAAAASDSNLWQAELGLGVCLLHLQKPDEALAAFERCLAEQAGNEQARFGQAVALQSLGRLTEAAEIYRDLLPSGKNNQELLANLIALSLAVRDEAGAREYSEALLRLRPQARAGLEGLVASALARADYKTAAQHGAKLVETAHDSYEAWYLLGLACQKLDRLDRAGQAYAEALKIRPTSAEALANMGQVLERRDD